ncbi:MAG: COG4315 family predicted lipoprotein [Candidatus Limnocylindrales bacterium]
MSPQRTLTGLVLAATIFAACTAAGGSPAATSAPAAPAPSSAAPAASAVATVEGTSSPTFGMILTGAKGLTLYTHSGDSAGASTCTGDCATAWPPLSVPSGQQPAAGTGVTGALTTLTRDDGTTQVAYDGMPLYYWQGDTKAGDVTGDGVNGFSVAKVSGGATPPSNSAAPSSSGGRYNY